MTDPSVTYIVCAPNPMHVLNNLPDFASVEDAVRGALDNGGKFGGFHIRRSPDGAALSLDTGQAWSDSDMAVVPKGEIPMLRSELASAHELLREIRRDVLSALPIDPSTEVLSPRIDKALARWGY